MFTKEDILKKLNSDNYYIDMNALDTFIKNGKLMLFMKIWKA